MKQARRGSHQNEYGELGAEDAADYRTLPKFKAYRERVRAFIKRSSPVTYGDLNREFGATDYLTEALDGLIADGVIRRDESVEQITHFVYSGTAIMPEVKWTRQQRKLALSRHFKPKGNRLYEY